MDSGTIRKIINRSYPDLSPVSREAVSDAITQLAAEVTALTVRVAALEAASYVMVSASTAVPNGKVLVGGPPGGAVIAPDAPTAGKIQVQAAAP